MTRRPLVTLIAVSALLWGTTRSDANLIVVENGTPSLDSFVSGGLTAGAKTSTATNLDSPIGLGVNPAGNLFVVNNGLTNSVAEYSPSLAPLGFFVPSNAGTVLNAPNDIAFDPSGNAYVTTGSTATGNNAVLEFNSAGTPVLAFGTASTNTPYGITFDPVTNGLGSGGGLLVVGDLVNSSVQVFDLTGAHVATLSTGLTQPLGIAVDAAGSIYVSDFQNSTIEKFTFSGGSYVGSLFATLPSAPGPIGLAFDTNVGSATFGDLFVAEANAGIIERLSPTGVDLGIYASGLNSPTFLAFTPNAAAVPEPGSVVMMGLGQVGLVGFLAIRRMLKARRAA